MNKTQTRTRKREAISALFFGAGFLALFILGLYLGWFEFLDPFDGK